MDHRTFAGWAIKGLEGALNILEMLITDGATFSPHFAERLSAEADRLRLLNEAAQQKVTET